MRNLSVAFVVVLLTILLVPPAQAGEVSPCSDCDKTVNTMITPVLPQGETEEIQPIDDPVIGDHTWGGESDGDSAYGRWVHWWWYVMNCLYYYHLDEI